MLNRLKETIQKKGNAVGTFLGVTNVPLMECLGYTGLDFVIIDTEHGPYDTQPMSDLIKAAELGGMAPIVRIADVTHKEIQRAVDNGAQGIIVPCLRSVDDFKNAVELAKFAPMGTRGFCKGRGSGFGNEPWSTGSLVEYMQNSNERVLMLPQCETKEALDNIEEIVQIEGMDGIFIGPFDLSICMGIPAQFDHPDFKAAIAHIIKVCKAAGKLCMIYTNNAEESRRYLEAGIDAVADSIDTVVFTEAYRTIVNQIRS
ncbi:MAG: hypothetical protein EOM62_18875 [Bacteroidia bacterium]|nr:hypothetical protein [Bacteroidia bacterium]